MDANFWLDAMDGGRYITEEKNKPKIPAGAETRAGGRVYKQDKFIGLVKDGKFVKDKPTEAPEEKPDKPEPKEKNKDIQKAVTNMLGKLKDIAGAGVENLAREADPSLVDAVKKSYETGKEVTGKAKELKDAIQKRIEDIKKEQLDKIKNRRKS